MFRFLLGFTYVLYILIKSSKSSSVLAAFNETCSDEILCTYPLICSNTNQCKCSKLSSVWSNDLNDCFYCPSNWVAWENNRCLSFAVPPQGGLSYEQANETCRSLSAQLLQIDNINELEQFEYQVNITLRSTFSSAVTLFFRLGAWIEETSTDEFADLWCAENEVDSALKCVYIKRNILKNNSLCLSRLKCTEEIPFICDMVAMSEKNTNQSGSSDQRFIEMLGELIPMAMNLLGGLFGGGQQTQAPAPPPTAAPQQIIIHQDPPTPAPQAASSSNIYLIIGLVAGGLVLLLLICCIIGVIIYLVACMKNPSSGERTNNRSSFESTSSNA